MGKVERVPRFIWRLLRFLPPRIAYALGLGSLVGGYVLLLHTTGRKSGLPRTTPLMYDKIDGMIYVASARGERADWYQNLAANPNVEVTIGARKYSGLAEIITDPVKIVDFLEHRLKVHPRIFGMASRMEGLSPSPTREQLEEYAQNRTFVAIHPTEDV